MGAASSGLVRALSPAIGHINHHIGKREADPEADADAQFIGLGIGHLGHVQRVAPVAVAHHVPVIAAAPVAVPRAPLCQAITRKVCKTIPVQVPKTIQTPVCVAVPKCTTVPNCVTITKPVCEITSRASPKTICDSVPKTSCQTVTDTVSENVCETREVQECVNVPNQIAIPRQVEECQQVSKNVCHPVAQKVARQVCQNVRVAVATPIARVHSSTVHAGHVGANYAYGDGNSFVR